MDNTNNNEYTPKVDVIQKLKNAKTVLNVPDDPDYLSIVENIIDTCIKELERQKASNVYYINPDDIKTTEDYKNLLINIQTLLGSRKTNSITHSAIKEYIEKQGRVDRDAATKQLRDFRTNLTERYISDEEVEALCKQATDAMPTSEIYFKGDGLAFGERNKYYKWIKPFSIYQSDFEFVEVTEEEYNNKVK